MTNDKYSQYQTDALIRQWLDIQAQAKALRAQEAELRKVIVERKFSGTEGSKGTFEADLGQGYSLKCVRKQTITVKSDKVDEMLDALERSGTDGKFIADRLVSFTPKLSVREYEALDAIARSIVDDAIVIKEATPTLTFVEPKVK